MPYHWRHVLCALIIVVGSAAIWSVAEANDELEPPTSVDIDDMLGPLAGQPCQLEASAGGVECKLADEAVFTLLHPALFPSPRQYRQRTEGLMPAGPVEWNGDYFYGVDNDLLRFDAQKRQIRERVRFPATIADIEVGEEVLEITVETVSGGPGVVVVQDRGDDGRVSVTLSYEPGQEQDPGRGPWDWSGTLGALHDAMWLDEVDLDAEPGASESQVQTTEARERAALAALRWRQELDVTNPYLALYQGEALLRLGDTRGADEAFVEAIEHDQAHWADQMRIGLRLEYRGFSELADQALERARTQMSDAGVRGEYITAMVNATYAFVWLQSVLADAVASGDLDTVHRVSGHVDSFFPTLEGAPMAWRRVAALFDDGDQPDKARYWRQRADELSAIEERPDRLFEEATEAVDIYFVLQLGLLISALLSGLILGLWRYEERDQSNETDESEDDKRSKWSQYLPQFYPVDLSMLGGLFVVLLLSPLVVAGPVQSMVTLAEAPAAASGDAVAAPAVGQWAGGLSDGGEFVTESQVELQATQAGGRGPGNADLNRLMIDAVEADTEARTVLALSDLEAEEQTLQQFQWLWAISEFEFDTTTLFLMFVMLTMNAVILGTLLQAVTRRIEVVAKVGRTIVPGGANSLRALRIPVLTAFVMGLLLMTPISRMAMGSMEATMAASFGLEAAPSGLEMTLPQAGFALVLVALVVHFVGRMWDSRG